MAEVGRWVERPVKLPELQLRAPVGVSSRREHELARSAKVAEWRRWSGGSEAHPSAPVGTAMRTPTVECEWRRSPVSFLLLCWRHHQLGRCWR